MVIGGLGSIGGAVAAAIAFGLTQVFSSLLSPTLAVTAPYLLLFFVLLWRRKASVVEGSDDGGPAGRLG